VTYIFPIQLNKPEYRSYVRSSGTYTMTATHGSFVLQKVMNELKLGKSIFELANCFTFTEGGKREITVSGDVVNQDVAVNTTPFNSTVNVTAPAYANNQVMMSLGLAEEANGLMIPTDLKRVEAGQSMELKSMGNIPSVLSLLTVDAKKAATSAIELAMNLLSPMNFSEELTALPKQEFLGAQNFGQLSFALQPARNGAAPEFLPLINPPTLDNGNVLKMDVPATLPAGLVKVATYMVLTEIQTFGTGRVRSEQRTRLWEIWSSAWLTQVELPKLNFPRNPDRKYRWEVMYLAKPANLTGGTVSINGVELSSVTHVTRNTLEL
jgi:hypothetical protein